MFARVSAFVILCMVWFRVVCAFPFNQSEIQTGEDRRIWLVVVGEVLATSVKRSAEVGRGEGSLVLLTEVWIL